MRLTRTDGLGRNWMYGVAGDTAGQRLFASLFGDLSEDVAEALYDAMEPQSLKRGDQLITAGDQAEKIYFVLSGRFEVRPSGRDEIVAEIGAGQPIGEIAFFTGGPRTADVFAARDSQVLALDRSTYDRLATTMPQVLPTIVATLAERLAETTRRIDISVQHANNRTVTLVPLSNSAGVKAFIEAFGEYSQRFYRGIQIDKDGALERFGRGNDTDPMAHALNELETRYDRVNLVTEPDAGAWCELAIRQADQILLIADFDDDHGPRPIEKLVADSHRQSHIRLVLLHPARQQMVEGTTRWIADRQITMHHHVALDDDADIARLNRFISGTAIGYVCAGGGAMGPAHLGIAKAFAETGTHFDMYGGTSVGAAMSGALAAGWSPDEINEGTGDIFVKSRSFKRPTLPRYALLDHINFDEALRRNYTEVLIEDLWRPYFAVSTNLSTNRMKVIRTGKLWHGIRASSAIPGVLPPFYSAQGEMLVDGCLIDNVPLKVMKTIKAGPNVVVAFNNPRPRTFDVNYEEIPGRRDLALSLVNPLAKKLPKAPGVANVIMRSLLANQRTDDLPLGSDDQVMFPPILPGMNFMSWDRHDEYFNACYEWALGEIRG